jgi:hypothetical protein
MSVSISSMSRARSTAPAPAPAPAPEAAAESSAPRARGGEASALERVPARERRGPAAGASREPENSVWARGCGEGAPRGAKLAAEKADGEEPLAY